jgi:hypothetical protein
MKFVIESKFCNLIINSVHCFVKILLDDINNNFFAKKCNSIFIT